MKVILDTNFLMLIGQFHIDVFSELERICTFPFDVCIIDGTIGELQKLAQSKGKIKRDAELALAILRAKKVTLISAKGLGVDDALVAQKDAIIATNDRGVIDRLPKKRVIRLRARRYLAFA